VRSIPKDYPPILYIPAARHVSDPADLEVLYRQTKDGRMALLVYSALDRLMRCCGEEQPWFLVPTAELQSLWDVRPFDLVLLDLPIPAEERQEAPA
jgi:hypothetical protein